MATRMQQRRGTAEQWLLADPVLAAGEIGYETDSSSFKIGDGINNWSLLDYFDTSSAIQGTIDDYVPLTQKGAALGVATLDANGFVPASQLDIDIAGDIDAAVSSLVDGAPGVLDTLAELAAALGDDENFASNIAARFTSNEASISDLQGADNVLENRVDTLESYNLDTRVTTNTDDISALQGGKAPSADPTFTGNVVLPATTSIGDVTSVEIGYLDGTSGNIQTQIDGKLATSVASSTYAPLDGATLTGTVSLPATTSIGDVTATELGYVNGVTSGIQGQLDAKAPLESPTFTGTVSGVSASMVGLSNVDNTSDLDKPVSTVTQTALNAKLDLAGGTMTGKITLDGDPTQALHAVTKQYVDNVEAGLITRPSVKAATTANLSGTYDNGIAGVGATLNLGQLVELSIDGVDSWSQGNGILVKNQTNKFENGRYVVEQIGNDEDTDWILRRCSLCDEADEIPGSYTFVLGGTINEQTGWVQYVANPDTFTVGTDDIDVYQFAGAGAVTAGTNISVTGSQVSVVNSPVFTGIVDASAAGVEFSDGVQTQAGVPSLTSFVEKTTGYTLDTLDHKDNVVEMNSSSPITFTIPTNATLAWPVGASMDIFQMGTGQVTIANAAGVTLNFTPGNKLRTQYSSCTIMKRGTDSWVLYGDLTDTSYAT